MSDSEIINKLLDYISTEKSNSNYKQLDIENKIHKLIINNDEIILRELTWKEGLYVDMKSFISNDGILLFNEKKEKLDILDLALLSINDRKVNISEISNSLLENIWVAYQKYLHLSLEEIDFLYKTSKKYFSFDQVENFPLHPLILEVDYMTKGIVHYSKTEFENLTMREFEAIQLILSAKNEI